MPLKKNNRPKNEEFVQIADTYHAWRDGKKYKDVASVAQNKFGTV